jgi:undecaprenyl-diphosphatase
VGDIIKSIVLGILEGITEFLPISSTGHLIIGTKLLDFRPELQGTFEIFIQLGAIVAVLIYYSRELYQQARTINYDGQVQRWWLAVIVAAIPFLILGFLLSDTIETFLRPSVVGVSMIVGGVIIFVSEMYQVRREPDPVPLTAAAPRPVTLTELESLPSPEEVTVLQAVVIGFFQLLALIPGMSRSAMTIIGGMFAGLPRPVATRFSFYLAIPVLGTATVYSLIKEIGSINSDDLVLLLIGAVVSGIVAWGVIAWLLRYVARHNFLPFAAYRVIVGIIILLLVAAGMLT